MKQTSDLEIVRFYAALVQANRLGAEVLVKMKPDSQKPESSADCRLQLTLARYRLADRTALLWQIFQTANIFCPLSPTKPVLIRCLSATKIHQEQTLSKPFLYLVLPDSFRSLAKQNAASQKVF